MADLAYDGSIFRSEDYTYTQVGNTIEDDTLTKTFSEFSKEIVATIDSFDISKINHALVRAGSALAVTNSALKDQQEMLNDEEANYKHTLNMALTGLSGGTEKSRLAAADLIAEESYNVFCLRRAKVSELKNLCSVIRTYIDSLISVSNNIRAEIKII